MLQYVPSESSLTAAAALPATVRNDYGQTPRYHSGKARAVVGRALTFGSPRDCRLPQSDHYEPDPPPTIPPPGAIAPPPPGVVASKI